MTKDFNFVELVLAEDSNIKFYFTVNSILSQHTENVILFKIKNYNKIEHLQHCSDET